MMTMKKILIPTIIAAVLLSLVPIISASTFNRPNLRVDNTAYGSLNWAGYAVNSGTYTKASGSWIVPTIQTTSTGYSSTWVGVGGFSGNTVIQIGTEQDCLTGTTYGEARYHGLNDIIIDDSLSDKPINNGRPGGGGGSRSSCKPVYYAWWEFYPQNAEQQIAGFTVSPGDVMTASVIQKSVNSDGTQTWTLTISDGTKIWSQDETTNFVPDQASAEAIIERPALCTRFSCKLTNLANFGTISYTVVSANGANFDSSANSITMVNNRGFVMAQPSQISSGSFSVQWYRSS